MAEGVVEGSVTLKHFGKGFADKELLAVGVMPTGVRDGVIEAVKLGRLPERTLAEGDAEATARRIAEFVPGPMLQALTRSLALLSLDAPDR